MGMGLRERWKEGQDTVGQIITGFSGKWGREMGWQVEEDVKYYSFIFYLNQHKNQQAWD